jgi:hypothetical protein
MPSFDPNAQNFFNDFTAIGSPKGGQAGPGGVFSGGAGGLIPNNPAAATDFASNLSPPGGGSPGFGLNTLKDADGVVTQQGLLSPALGIAGAGFNIYSGLKQLGIQEDTLDFTKDAFKKNFAASKAAFQERLRGNYGRKATLGGNKDQTEEQFVAERSDF